MHWTLDTVFHDDVRRDGEGHGAINMAIIGHFAFNLVRTLDDKRSLKNRRKRAGWDTKTHLSPSRNPDLLTGNGSAEAG